MIRTLTGEHHGGAEVGYFENAVVRYEHVRCCNEV
jgi:hypothetical protein